MRVVTVIPARYGSTRLPAKPLADLNGKPMIEWVYARAARARGISETIVATDDERIAQVVRGFGGKVCMTDPAIASGTDRVAAVAREVNADFFINVQGDEPLIDPGSIEKAAEIVTSGRYPMGTLSTQFESPEELEQSSVVKVIRNLAGRAVAFSRFPIPYSRAPAPADPRAWVCRKHMGIYSFSRETLLKFSSLPPTDLEKAESLEQLRAFHYDIPIGIEEVDCRSIGVDLPEDLEKVRNALRGIRTNG